METNLRLIHFLPELSFFFLTKEILTDKVKQQILVLWVKERERSLNVNPECSAYVKRIWLPTKNACFYFSFTYNVFTIKVQNLIYTFED